MKIAILARNPDICSHKRLVEAAAERGHALDIVDTLHCYLNIASRRPSVYHNGEKLTDYDAVVTRIGASITFYGMAVLRQSEVMGANLLNESVAIGRSRDKLRSMQLLARDGVGLPTTTFAHDPKQTEEVLKLAGSAPLAFKLHEGMQGLWVVLTDTDRSAKSVIEAFRANKTNILVQEFIKEAGGEDIWAIVIGGKVVATMKRKGRRTTSGRTATAEVQPRSSSLRPINGPRR